MRALWKLLAVGLLLVATAAVAQTPGFVPPTTTIPIFERISRLLEAALTWTGSTGFIFLIGVLARKWNKIPNVAVPYITGLANVFAIGALVLKKLGEAATGVALADDATAIQAAGLFGAIGGFVTMGIGIFATAGAGAIQRWLWEKWGRHVVVPETVKGQTGF